MIMIYSLLFFLVLNSGSNLYDINTDEWKFEKENEFMKVWTRKRDDGGFKEIKIVASIPCTMKELVEALIDVETHDLWVFKVRHSSLVRRVNPTHFIYYVEIDMPFPVVDRDAVLLLEVNKEGNGRHVEIITSAALDEVPTKDGYVRITDYFSRYILTEAEDHVKIDYFLSLDPAGKLPTWVTNLAAIKGPIKTMEALYERLAGS